MTEQDWTEWFAKSFMLFLNGDALRSRDERGGPVRDDSFLLLFNAHVDPVTFTLPGDPWGQRWISVPGHVAGSMDSTTTRPSIRADPALELAGSVACRFSGAADGILPAEAGSHKIRARLDSGPLRTSGRSVGAGFSRPSA